MSNYTFSFVHDRLPGGDFRNLTAAVGWLLGNCPAYASIPGLPFPSAPLNGQLVTARFEAATSNSGSGYWQSHRNFHYDGTDNPISWVLDEPMIVLNGRKSFGSDYLFIGAKETDAWQTVDTEGKPYTLLVAATLLLANHLTPGSWSLASSAPDEVWEAALEWARQFDAGVTLPASLRPNAGLASTKVVRLPVVRVPQGLDFRA